MLPKTADESLWETVRDCLDGDYVETPKDKSFELLHYTTGMSNPRARITTNPFRPLNIVTAIARFTWLIAGNNRLEDIAFYEPKVRGYTDDGLTVPGSDYGFRLFNSSPGVDQIQGVIDRLVSQRSTRQASAVVWLPEDAVRHSSDIPCTFGMFFNVRNRKEYVGPLSSNNDIPNAYKIRPHLTMCTVMRSNNAFRLLPFNLFEFSMLQEIIASTVSLPLGDYVHWAASMHVYDNENEMPTTRQLLDFGVADSIVMPPMPPWNAMLQARTMAQLEAKMRHVANESEFGHVLHEANEQLNEYWIGLFKVLARWFAMRRDYLVTFALPDYLSESTLATIRKARAMQSR